MKSPAPCQALAADLSIVLVPKPVGCCEPQFVHIVPLIGPKRQVPFSARRRSIPSRAATVRINLHRESALAFASLCCIILRQWQSIGG
jgi:hypothetical protein